jgi:hypothetical protein
LKVKKAINMRILFVTLTAAALLALAACGPSGEGDTAARNANVSNAAATTAGSAATPASGAQTGAGLPPVTSAHGGGAQQQPAQPAAPAGGAASNPAVNTAELDAKIERAEAKAKAASAVEADKRAAAAAYIERGNVYYEAGAPALYKFALGDFRRALKYDPANSEARAKMTQIVQIYESMGRPVPPNGLEQ